MDFSDISSYSDAEVPAKLCELESNLEFHNYISNIIFPKSHKYLSKLTNAYVRLRALTAKTHCKELL